MKTAALGDLVDFYSGGTPSKANAGFWEGDVPWFSAKDMKRDRLSDSADHISESVFTSTSLRRLPAGTIAMVVRGMILSHTVPISILEVPAAINQDLKALLPRGDADTAYLAAMLRAQHSTILSKVSTAAHGTKKLDSRVLEAIEIPIPPLDEQRRIAAILAHADALRATRRQVLAHFGTLPQSIFQDMFGDAAWTSTLGELSDIQIGPFGSLLHQDDYVSGGVPVLNPTHIQDRRLMPDYQFSVTDEKAASLPLYRVRSGDVLLGRRGEMGRAGIATSNHEGMLCGTGSLILRPRSVETTYLHAVVTSPRMKIHLQRNSLGATLPNLNAGIVRSSPAPTVSLQQQSLLAARLRQVDIRRAAVRAAERADDQLFASLESRAFRGDL